MCTHASMRRASKVCQSKINILSSRFEAEIQDGISITCGKSEKGNVFVIVSGIV